MPGPFYIVYKLSTLIAICFRQMHFHNSDRDFQLHLSLNFHPKEKNKKIIALKWRKPSFCMMFRKISKLCQLKFHL